MPDPVKHGLVGVCLLAATLIIVPAIMDFAFYALAIIGVAAIARMLIRLDGSLVETEDHQGSSMSANDPSSPDTPGRPR